MALTKKKNGTDAPVSTGPTRTAPEKPRNVAAYEAAVTEFAAASQLFGKGAYAEAKAKYDEIAGMATAEEPILADRARTYASICAQKLGAVGPSDSGPESLYHRGVFAANAGKLDEALALLDQAGQARPNDASVFYARAAVRGLQGNADGAATELKKAVALDPKFRYQAASDPDFDRVRDEASFIDVIEPTSTSRT